ncbi:hypothetical protein [Tateyamaria sp.]|uniref:hypothetical protein n=1 Tax=Tateyamaria sp. TaxID=1929288 RepID=UPI00329FF16D
MAGQGNYPEGHGPGFGAHKPTKADRELVRNLAANGFSERVISDKLGVARNTLRKHFADELQLGRAENEQMLVSVLQRNARQEKDLNASNRAATTLLSIKHGLTDGSRQTTEAETEAAREAEIAASNQWLEDKIAQMNAIMPPPTGNPALDMIDKKISVAQKTIELDAQDPTPDPENSPPDAPCDTGAIASPEALEAATGPPKQGDQNGPNLRSGS